MVKALIKKHFHNFVFFYRYLRGKIFLSVFLSITVGFLDGLGLAMFLPLLRLVDGSSAVAAESMGNFAFLIHAIEGFGIKLSLVVVLAFISVFFLLKGIAKYIQGAYQVTLQQFFIKTIRINNLKNFSQVSYKYFIGSDAGRIQNTLTGEVYRVSHANVTYFRAMQDGILVLVYMGFAFMVDAKFAILVTVGGVLTNFLFSKIYKKTKGASVLLTNQTNLFQGLIIQAVSNFKYLKATGHLMPYIKKLVGQVNNIEKSNKRIGILTTILNSSREPLIVLVVCLVILLQTLFLNSSLAGILVSLLFFYRALSSLMQMQISWNSFLSVSGSMVNMTNFTLELEQNRESTGKAEFAGFNDGIVLKDVGFCYENTTILKNITLLVKRNETVALVGESGSGKTTLANILSGLIPINSGQHFVDGLNSDEINMHSFHKRIGYITQDPVVFNDTIFNNVTFWDDPITDNMHRFIEACKKASIFEFVDNLEQKQDTVLGNNGINLSGGQKQRISIARELYKDIDILILDEATSALDSETEQAIMENINLLKGQYTMLIIAHRLSTIVHADKIVLLKAGEIVQVGTYSELVNTNEMFRQMVKFQSL
jgi:subfamily B ATP-binding cassette protein MsbA